MQRGYIYPSHLRLIQGGKAPSGKMCPTVWLVTEGIDHALLQVVVIITDGHSDSQTQTIIQANYMKLAGIKIVCVGVVQRLDLGYLELQQIATDPEEVVQLQVDAFNLLQSKLLTLLAAACPDPPPPGLYADF